MKERRLPTDCKVCGALALYSYYGVVVCSSCKVFFKRNAQKKPNHFKCIDQNRCEINISSRHLCSYCRLQKCLASGMQVRMIRSSKPNTTKTSSVISTARRQIPTLSLLRSDQSKLTKNQWILLANLAHCYDEYSGFAVAQRFIRQQNELPPKMRFKLAAMGGYASSLLSTSQLLYEKNVDFNFLCSHDRSILLHNTMKYVAGLCFCLITRRIRVIDDPGMFKSIESMYGSQSLTNGIRAIDQLDSDSIFIKLALSLLVFSTFNYTFYTNRPPENLINIRAVLYIQDRYTELIWRYLLYRYDHQRAVGCFSNLLRCLFLINSGIVEVYELEHYREMINSIVKQTKKILTLNA